MATETITETTQNPAATDTAAADTSLDYINAINTLKANSVPKTDYEALLTERNQLITSLLNSQTVSTETVTAAPNIDELRHDLFVPDHELSDIEFATKALALRKAVMDQDGNDIFVGSSSTLTPTSEDYEKAQRVADVLQECIETSNGSNATFMANFGSRLVEPMMPNKARGVRR